jgi:predicted DsbA family dithiol-disulfide isomerase
MARLAFRFAMASERVTAEAIEAQSFAELAMGYGVRAVPHSVINGTKMVVGAVPERMLIDAVEEAATTPSTT